MTDLNLDQWIANASAITRAHRLATLRRWGQEKCECGKPLETLFDTQGKNPIRICVPCRIKEDDLDAERADAEAAEQAAWDDIWPI